MNRPRCAVRIRSASHVKLTLLVLERLNEKEELDNIDFYRTLLEDDKVEPYFRLRHERGYSIGSRKLWTNHTNRIVEMDEYIKLIVNHFKS